MVLSMCWPVLIRPWGLCSGSFRVPLKGSIRVSFKGIYKGSFKGIYKGSFKGIYKGLGLIGLREFRPTQSARS